MHNSSIHLYTTPAAGDEINTAAHTPIATITLTNTFLMLTHYNAMILSASSQKIYNYIYKQVNPIMSATIYSGIGGIKVRCVTQYIKTVQTFLLTFLLYGRVSILPNNPFPKAICQASTTI